MATLSRPAPRREAVDGVRMALLMKRIEGITNKMQNTLLRTARSGVINNGRDFSCSIVTGGAQLLAVGESLPIHVMVGSDMMARSMMDFHPDLGRGDAYLHNSPYHGCSHAADLTVLVPVIDDGGVHRFTVLAKAHQADIGNAIPTTYHASARDVYEEGALIFPAVRVQRDYSDIGDIIRVCMMRIRVPEQWRGDYLASLGAARIGERELLALGAEVGWDMLEATIGAWLDHSERRMVMAIERLPGGHVTACCVHDPFPGTPANGVPVKAVVAVDPGAAMIDVDLRDNPDCMPCGLNLSEACARSAALIGVFNGMNGAQVPTNAGSFRRVRVHLRDNCIVGVPRHPTSCSVATSNVSDRLTNAVHLAMADLGEGIGMAEIGASQTAAQAVISGRDPRFGDAPFINQLLLGDTLGAAAPCEDGWPAMLTTGTAGLSMFDSVEVDELRHPILVYGRSIEPDTEGPGRFRGAPSSRVEYGAVGCSIRVVYQSDGSRHPAVGARGGMAGGPARNFRRMRSGEQVEADGWVELEIEPGERMIGISCGGGGYGSPLERDPARVKHDVDEGYITLGRAEAVYGVAFDVYGVVDIGATEWCREPRQARGLTS